MNNLIDNVVDQVFSEDYKIEDFYNSIVLPFDTLTDAQQHIIDNAGKVLSYDYNTKMWTINSVYGEFVSNRLAVSAFVKYMVSGVVVRVKLYQFLINEIEE